MLNEEKIRLMTDIAIFEKKNGKRMKSITSYFKSDFISRNLLRGFLSFTACSILVLVMWAFFNVEIFFSSAGLDTLIALLKRAAFIYVTGLVLYLALVCTIYAKRYDTEARKNRLYVAKLKHLDKRYEYQSRVRELTREGRRL